MADVADKPKRKSVAFSDGTTIVDSDGQVTEMNGVASPRDSAESHSTKVENGDKTIESVTDDFDAMALKAKKKKKKAPKEDDADNEAPAADDAELDLSALKKKKKKKAKPVDDSFEAKLEAAAGDQEGERPAAEPQVEEGDPEKGTGIWKHDSQQPVPYNMLLSRFFTLLHSHHPDLASSGSKSYKIPPPQLLREGNKKTIFANIPEICKRMKRTDEHVTQFLFAELGTSGSVDGSRRLVIKGRFQQKQIEAVLRRYIGEYVTCKTCRSPDTELSKGENRLNFVTCNSCGSRRSVQAIKTGFSAQIGKRKRQQG